MNNPNHKPNEATIKWLASLPPPPPGVARAREYWRRFLARPPKSQEEWGKAYRYAMSWTFCACGVSLPAELRVGGIGDNPPNDEALSLLGGQFAEAVEDRDWPEACAVFGEIQIREDELLNEDSSDE